MKKWEEIPECMRNKQVREYYDILVKKRGYLILRRIFEFITSAVLLVLLSPVFLILIIAIKLDSPGPVFFRQIRVTQYGRMFRILKFRTMINNSDKTESLLTVSGCSRITKVGRIIRKYRLDELSQLIDVFLGNMSFVGTRPEVPKYVSSYTPEMLATLLLPAGITSEASIRYKDEDKLLASSDDVENFYVEHVLPAKVTYHLKDIKQMSFRHDLSIIFRTLFTLHKNDHPK